MCAVRYEKDQPITLRDGTIIYGDFFKPVEINQPCPVVLTWTPYDKIAPPLDYQAFPNNSGMENRYSCGFDTFEGPEPDYWVSNGYILAVVDSRGSTNSEGDLLQLGNQEGLDIYDTIEFLAAQDWCNGKVGMTGNSWLAIYQYFAAALQPSHLAAIAS